MRRHSTSNTEVSGQDSFLDIVANMVGILIILVVVVGVRAGQAPVELAESTEQETEQNEVLAYRREALSLEKSIHQLSAMAQQVKSDTQTHLQMRNELSGLITQIEEEIKNRKENLDVNAQRDYELQNKLAHLKSEFTRIDHQRAQLAAVQPQKIKIQNLPTPLSKTVHGNEVHFQLRGGKIQHIPLTRLLTLFRQHAERNVHQLKNQMTYIDRVGPIAGFALEYHLGRTDLSTQTQLETGQTGSVIRLLRWELIPVSDALGESLAVALARESNFRNALQQAIPGRTAITIWTYPDSFDAFRKIKAELHSLGFPTASRPLPEDILIGGSPEGSRSAAQ